LNKRRVGAASLSSPGDPDVSGTIESGAITCTVLVRSFCRTVINT